MHNAPTVSYPVGRSYFQAGLTLIIVVTALLVGLTWSVQAAWNWRHALMGGLLSLASVLALWEWRRTLQGMLTWDGDVWCFIHDQKSIFGSISVRLDFQFVLLLRLTPNKGPCLWLWAERHRQGALWAPLRRAAFSRHQVSLSSASKEADSVLWRHP